MKRNLILTIVAFFVISLFTTAYAQSNEAQTILTKVDEVSSAPQDQYVESTMILKDKNGDQNERKMIIYQKDGDKRIVRFLSPADQKGISFLSLPDDLMYLYLPAFRKVRMIASHIKNQNFAGTDFSYDDMSSFSFAKDYDSQLLETSDSFYFLKLIPKEGLKKDYSQLKMTVNKDSFIPSKIEYFDKNEKLWKILTAEKIEKFGEYNMAMLTKMKDIKKSHSTKMIINKIEFDKGLSDNLFTKRNLKRVR